jgi:hypothetical protein
MKQSIYLSGPMTGRPDHNFPLFNAVADMLRAGQFDVLNPAENFDGRTDLPRREYMRRDFALLQRAGAIAMLPEWEQSDGARAEYVQAREMELAVYRVTEDAPGDLFVTQWEHPPAVTVVVHGLQAPAVAKPETILEEAARLTSHDRQGVYGHPKEDFARTALIWTGILRERLKPGLQIRPEDVPLCMIGVKLAREAHRHKRDNPVDIAGYANTLAMLFGEDAQ